MLAHTDGVFNYRVRACKTFACSGWSVTKQVVVYHGGGGDVCDPLAAPSGTDTSGTSTQSLSTESTDPSSADAQLVPPPPGC